MCSRSSSQVITPGVASGATNFGHCVHLGYAPTSLHISSHTPASLFCTCMRCSRSVPTLLSDFWSAEAVFLQSFSLPWPQATKLSMCSRSSSQVITPGVASGATNLGHCVHLGYAPTSLHMSSHTPASLFCTCIRCSRSVPTLLSDFWRADACFFQLFSLPWPQATKLSMCSNSSSHVITPGVESGATNFGHCVHFGYAPTSLHMSSHTPASLFCTCARRSKSVATLL